MNSVGILIPLMGITCGIIAILSAAYIKSQQIKLQIAKENSASGASSADVQNEIQRLKDRVAVLERLLTDGDRKLSREIDGLRSSERI